MFKYIDPMGIDVYRYYRHLSTGENLYNSRDSIYDERGFRIYAYVNDEGLLHRDDGPAIMYCCHPDRLIETNQGFYYKNGVCVGIGDYCRVKCYGVHTNAMISTIPNSMSMIWKEYCHG